MCDGDCDRPSAYKERWRRARKNHTCCACRESIEPGHRYHYTSGVWDGEPGSFKHCARCWAIFRALVAESDLDLVDLDLSCGIEWEEAFGGPPPNDVAELAFLTAAEAQGRVNDTV